MKFILTLAVFLLLASLGGNVWQWQKSQNQNLVEVARVIDGDTFETANQQTVRIYGIEAPEITICGGIEAKKELEK
jgi:endonuclease YncB( thermonuclease family)